MGGAGGMGGVGGYGMMDQGPGYGRAEPAPRGGGMGGGGYGGQQQRFRPY